jgi:ankyrin repeat protein
MFQETPESASQRDAESRTPLHYAAEIPNHEIFAQLLSVDPSLIDSQVGSFAAQLICK